MRKLINVVWMAFLLGGSLDSHGQGTVRFLNSSESLVTNFFAGQPVEAGTTFLAALYYAPDGVTDENLLFQIGTPASFTFPGFFSGGTRITPNTTAYFDYAMLQVRVWESAFGSSYEEAIAAAPVDGRLALTGKSDLLRYMTGCDSCVPVPPPPPRLEAYGFKGFYVIPEPRIVPLSLLGAAAALGTSLFARRKTKTNLRCSKRS